MLALPTFRSGVSLHGHTLHSNESLRFLYTLSHHSSFVRTVLQVGEKRYAKAHGHRLDLNRAWWTPPVGPRQALTLERAQLEQLGLAPIVSLTDHDSIKAAVTLRAIDNSGNVPISVEWTLPYLGAELHLGVHNLPPDIAVELAQLMAGYTRNSARSSPVPVLEFIAAEPGTLIVFNHPLWDEIAAGENIHFDAVQQLLESCGKFIHALEWNGLRCYAENKNVVQLARRWGKSVVAGGDRHGFEPNSVINLTNASSFTEFADEIRQGQSTVMLTKTYFYPKFFRIWQTVREVFSVQPDHPRGWVSWSDRVFYAAPESRPVSLTSLWGDDVPLTIRSIQAALDVMKQFPVDYAMNLRGSIREPVVLSYSS